jgi:sugar phosphate isomerase/epimerase
MKISVSNIIWKKGKENLPSFFSALSKHNINGVELALSCFFEEPTDVSLNELKWLKELLNQYNLELVSLHSLTYTRPELELFLSKKNRDELIDYLCKYIDIANTLGCENIVFGSPKSRKTYEKDNEQLNNIFIDTLSKIDSYSDNVNFNIEPLSTEYCNYLNTFMEGVELIKNHEFNNIFIQLDVRSVIESNENIVDIFSHFKYIKHVHTGNPGMKIPGDPYKKIHNLVMSNLKSFKYNGYITAEVVMKNNNSVDNYLKKTVKSMRKFYG